MIYKIFLCLISLFISCNSPHLFDPNKEYVDLSNNKIQYKIISMPKSVDRRSLMEKQLLLVEDALDNKDIGKRSIISWSWLDAIDGSATSPEVIKASADNKISGNLRPGETGILLTTTDKIYPLATIFDGISVFFEDDLILRADLDFQLRNALRKVPNDWDILYLGCNLNYNVGNGGKVRTHFYDAEYLTNNGFTVKICTDDDIYHINGTPWYEVTNQCITGGWAYALNTQSGKKLLEIVTKNKPYDRSPIDLYIRPHFGYDLKAYCLNPELVHHRDDLQSTIR